MVNVSAGAEATIRIRAIAVAATTLPRTAKRTRHVLTIGAALTHDGAYRAARHIAGHHRRDRRAA